ncbi:BcPKS5, polyketide synthase [Mollisia scopiformis]|uniref:BcPKS5, polyketide synthase n=1 Tax=Mollisia scopiformis TaxID=149040 RepID=A0A194XPW8_MOLSC|nr:BcPKS5, polyketide synthase [Mollisia scopiformis]KUJ22238.1 BcPKS5, polyketide synthase [Mollisia scopiformis]
MAAVEQEPIAVIGMACRFPGSSNSPSKLWDLLRSPRDLSKRVPTDRFDVTGFHHSNGSHHGATDATNAYFIEEDVNQFDSTFFNIQPAEAEAIDPQQRLLMETVYDSISAGGQPIETLRGTNTAVYVGLMCDDWSQIVCRDWDLMPTYAATGTSRAIISNRISYFFNWHGASMTIDTACSSSLVAVHQGVTALRNGECPVAIAAGANLILAPGMFIGESNLHMLSPTGSSKMWDSAADGYARGEGIASIVMKPLSAALRDGDHIDCIIRGTAVLSIITVNQDGKTAGLTMPSNLAQADLIRDTYARAGLDINDPKDRPQYFHAHGTGTPAGDPQEAEAISRSFFGDKKVDDRLYVGSIKTVIGHTEGAAGLASLIGSALAMQHGIIPPNLHFNSLSARVAPYYNHLEIPITAKPWPKTLPGQPRRASVNSFGFGGTNAHAIIEYFEPESSPIQPAFASIPAFTPLTISAASPTTLRSTLSDLSSYLKNSNLDANIRDLAYTLQTRRSILAYRKPIIATSIEEAITRIDGLLADDNSSENGLTTRYYDVSTPSVLGVFTGQGAQWATMGARLIEESPFVAQRLAQLQRALATLPEGDRPDWTLTSQLLAGTKSSRIAEAAIAQPLCTAIQIVLVDLLKAANIRLGAVVGHSSGEIGAAYAAGFLSATDAIRVAYYRGLYAKLSRSPSGGQGAMMAVGTSIEDAQEFCELEDFDGRIQVAARNSQSSITLSGDEDAIQEALAIFSSEGKFARMLKVDTAYHSTHMLPCAKPYLAGLARAGYSVGEGNDTTWCSSVIKGHIMTKKDVENPRYWVDNMTNAVLFEPAISQALDDAGPFDIAIEYGPHPALKGPALDTVEAIAGRRIPYTGLLSRGKNDVDELSSALGYIWTQLGASSIDFDGFEKFISGTSSKQKRFVFDLPTYRFDHSRSFNTLTRFSGGHTNLHAAPHPLLGRRLVETETSDEISYRNVLRPAEITWIQGHGLQGQSVFPAMGYVSAAVEVIAAVTADRNLGLITLNDIVIGRALAFTDENAGMETKVSLSEITSTEDEMSARMTFHSGLPFDSSTPLALNFSATIHAVFCETEPDTLPAARIDEINLVEAEPERLYTQFSKLGYNYSLPFTGVRSIQRKKGWAAGDIEDESGDGWEDKLLVHPGWLDSAVQTGFAAYSHPHDNRLFALLVPTAIHSIVINPYFFNTTTARHRNMQYQTTAREDPEAPMVVDIDIFPGGDDVQSYPFVQFESLRVMPFAPATARDDAVLFSRFNYRLAAPDAVAAVAGEELLSSETTALWKSLDRASFFYLRRLHETITSAERAAALPHFQLLLDYIERLVAATASGECPVLPREALADSPTFIRSLISRYHDRADMQMIEAVGENFLPEIQRNGNMLEHMMKDGLLDRFYADTAGVIAANSWIASIVAQIAHRYPRMHLFEVGAGTGSTTRPVLSALKGAFSSYTFTDIGAGFISRAQDGFTQFEFSDRMSFAKFDLEQSPEEQGFVDGAYDIVIASNVLHATGKLDEAMDNVRRLLRPGGYLIALEIVSEYTVSMNTMMGGIHGWWAGAAVDQSRRDGPCLTLERWDALMRTHGFSGVDSHTPVLDNVQWFSVFVSQAVDDFVGSLRAPLNASKGHRDLSPLVIIGRHTSTFDRLVDEVSALAGPRSSAVTRFESLEDLNKHGLSPGSSVLSLAELDEQFFEVRTESKLNALKTLWRNGGSILWVTRSAMNERPFSSIILGLSRVVRLEYPNINLQILDFDAATEVNPQNVAEALIRLELGAQFKKEEGAKVDLLWTVEPETHYINGQLHIPRLLPDTDANKRYNTYRRTTTDEVDLHKTPVVLDPAPDGKTFDLAIVSPLRVLPELQASGKIVTIQVEQSLLQIIKIRGVGYFNLLIGKDVENGEKLATLVDSAIESRARVPIEWTMRVPKNILKNTIYSSLVSVGAYLLAQSILVDVPRSGTILVHEADELLKEALQKEAMREGLRIVFTSGITKTAYIFIHEKLPMRLVQSVLPRDITFFVNLDPGSATACLLTRSLPPHTATAISTDFIRTQAGLSPNADVDQVGPSLKKAWQAVTNYLLASSSSQKPIPVLRLQDVSGSSAVHAKLSVVDWTISSSPVRALLRPIDHGNIFRDDGTYLLFGLAGDLGQSLCTWMVTHGARYIVLGSRRPKVNPRFIESLSPATIKVVAVDVTRRDSLNAAYDEICVEMPPVVGVANGAMLLEDALFDDLEFTSLERTAPPKIDGSVLLDELFYDALLDFFILFTSTSNVVGNGGQSAYVMANQFMAALAAQRRDVRGVAGSDIAIGFVYGLGYFEHATHLDIDHFLRLSYRGISEQDLHALFAEAMLAGRPSEKSKGISEIATGVSPFRDEPQTHIQLRTNPRFSHFLMHDAGSNGVQHGGSGGGTERPRARLAAATSLTEAQAILREAFVDRLKRILMIPQGESMDEKSTFVEQGVDSIMAVEVRTWFLQELDVDLPVLKIMGVGSTVESLLVEVMEKIPVDILELEKLGSGTGTGPGTGKAASIPPPAPAPVASAPTHTFSAPSPPTKPSTESTDSDADTESWRVISTPNTPPEMSLHSLVTPENDHERGKRVFTALERQQEEIRRKAIIDSSTEHTGPMTYGQKRFWFLANYVDDQTTFNIAYMFKLAGHIRINDLTKAVQTVAQRHEALRTRFFWSEDDSKTPMQGILSKPIVRLETGTIESEAQAAEELEAMRNHKWNLGDWIQLRLRLLSLSDTSHYLVMGTHHISLDGHSMNMLMFDINQAYTRPGKALSPMPDTSQARAFGAQQVLAYKTGKLRPAIDYFRRTLQSVDMNRPIQLFSFARSQVRVPLDRYGNNVSRIRLDPQIAARMKQLVRGHQSTSFHGYLAALQALIFRLLPADTTDKVVIGIADANRIESKFMGSLGNFLNILPLLFNRPDRGQTFGKAIEEARSKVYGAMEFSALPFDLLLDELSVPRSNTYTPVCQVLMDYKLVTREQANMSWAGCKVSEHKWHTARSTYDIALEIVEDHESALVALHVQDGLYNKEATDLILRSYVNVLNQVVQQDGDTISTEKLDKWDSVDVRNALELGQGPSLPLEWPATVAHRIDQIIAKYPNNLAIKDGFGHILTYAALDERVESIAQILRKSLPDQNREQSVVGVFQTPAADWIASLVAILRTGAIYLPLDLKVSAARLKGYVNVAGPAVILADSETVGRTKEIGIESTASVINVSDLPAKVKESKEKIATAAQADRPAYIIFTSGSTGEPKGVVIKHSSFRALAEGFVREWDITSLGRVVLQQIPLTSDGSLKQIISAITTGGCLVVASADARGDPTELTRLMADNNVTFSVATPSEWNMWFRFAPQNLRCCTSLTSAWFGGERAPQSLLDSFRDLRKTLPNLRVFNTYGPTEATISTVKGETDLNNPNLVVPVPSRILPNYTVYIVDEESQTVPVSVPGEIVIGGAGVGNNEYLNRPDLTAKQFPADSFVSNNKEGRVYYTGDYGRLDSHGLLAIEGRIAGDAQVKVRGFRVELGEIEGVIMKEASGAVTAAVVTLDAGESDHDGLLIAHIVVDKNKHRSEAQIAEIVDQLSTRLALSLPQYMVPAEIILFDEVPLTAHGKVDRKAVQGLPRVVTETSVAVREEQQKSFTVPERRLADIWATILPAHLLAAKPLTPRTDFFRAGGNSLMLVQLQAAIKQALGDAPRLNKLMNTPELAEMAALLESSGAAPDWDKEIAVSDLLNEIPFRNPKKSSTTGLRVLVTGATGSLGKHIIPHLATNPRVTQIVVLARPAEGRDLTHLFPSIKDKLLVVHAELPSIPADNIVPEMADIDVILHIAADRNFWDGYSALKPVNVITPKLLAKLALRIGAALHVLSSGAVVNYEADSNGLPRPEASDGYVASKWVAERYLANAARQTGIEVTAHRPTKTATIDQFPADQKLTEAEEALIHSILINSPRLGVRPDFTHIGGTFYIAPVEDVATAIAAAVAAGPQESDEKTLRIINHPGTASVRTEIMASRVEELFKQPENEAVRELPSVPVLHWVGKTKRAGLFEWIFTSQELIVIDEEGRKVVSRR